MQASTATKEGKPALNWRQRKKLVARRKQLADRRPQLIDEYVQELGSDRVTALVRLEIERVVDMTLLAEGMRARALRGEAIDIGDLTRLEGAVSRMIRSLNLRPPGAAAPGDDAWRKFLANHQHDGDG